MKPSFDDECLCNRVERTMCMLEDINMSKGVEVGPEWSADTENKWFGKESEDCVIGKFESWKDVRKMLCDHYEWEEWETDSEEE